MIPTTAAISITEVYLFVMKAAELSIPVTIATWILVLVSPLYGLRQWKMKNPSWKLTIIEI
jgi:hypothetical protein